MRTAPKYIVVHMEDADGNNTRHIACEMSPWWELVDEDDFVHEYVIDDHYLDEIVRHANAGTMYSEQEHMGRYKSEHVRLQQATAEYWTAKAEAEERRINYNKLKKENAKEWQ